MVIILTFISCNLLQGGFIELFDICLIPPVKTAVSSSQKDFCCGHCSSYFKDINELEQHSCIPKSSNNNQVCSWIEIKQFFLSIHKEFNRWRNHLPTSKPK